MAIYKVNDVLFIEIKKVLESYTNTDAAFTSKIKDLGKFLIKRKKRAEKLIKLLEKNYFV